MPNKNAVKGHNLERAVINDVKPFWSYAKSARETSRLLDNVKVDINFIPVLIQCKATQMRPNFQKLWEECMELIDKWYPPAQAEELKSKPYIIVHKDTTRRAGKNKPHVQTMTMTYEFGLELLELWAKQQENE